MKSGKTKKILVGAILLSTLALPVFNTNLIHNNLSTSPIESSYITQAFTPNGYNVLRGERKEVTMKNEQL